MTKVSLGILFAASLIAALSIVSTKKHGPFEYKQVKAVSDDSVEDKRVISIDLKEPKSAFENTTVNDAGIVQEPLDSIEAHGLSKLLEFCQYNSSFNDCYFEIGLELLESQWEERIARFLSVRVENVDQKMELLEVFVLYLDECSGECDIEFFLEYHASLTSDIEEHTELKEEVEFISRRLDLY